MSKIAGKSERERRKNGTTIIRIKKKQRKK
jgi:hypothetical protein